MVQVRIDNSFSQISGLTSSQLSALRKVLSYTKNPDAAFYQGGFIRKSYMIDKRGRFPTGLYNRVAKWLQMSEMRFAVDDKRRIPHTYPTLFTLRGFTPYQWQSKAATVAGWSERGGIVAPTGTGKSAAIAMILVELQVPALIVVPTLEIKVQLMADITKLFGSLNHVRVENIDSSALEGPTMEECLILDECHHAAAKTYQKLNKRHWNGIYFRFFLSATFFRNDENETLPFEAICGGEIFRLTYASAVNCGYIVPIEAYYYDLPKKPTEAFTWREVFNELVVHNEDRNKLIADTLQDLHLAGKPTLCLVKEIAHGEILSAMTGFPFVNGQDEASRRHIAEFKSGEIDVLIGTEGILGEGVDTKPAEYVVITGLGKAKSSFMQKVGRVLRTFPGKESGKVIFFRDPSHKFTLRHFTSQKKILKEEYGVLAVKL